MIKRNINLILALICFLVAGILLFYLVSNVQAQEKYIDYYLITDKWVLYGDYYVHGRMFKYPGFTNILQVTEAVYNTVDLQNYAICKFWDFEGDRIMDAVYCYRVYRVFLPLGLGAR